MNVLTRINSSLSQCGAEHGQRVVEQLPPFHQPSDPPWPPLAQQKRRPFPAQTLAIMRVIKRWEEAQ